VRGEVSHVLAYFGSTVVQRLLALIIPIILAECLVTPPTVIAPSSLFALLALLTAQRRRFTTFFRSRDLSQVRTRLDLLRVGD
jgi:hypothetical protein